MPLIATAGLSTSNAYCTPGEALALLMPILRPEILEDEAILTGMSEALVWATRLIEEQVSWRWTPLTPTQALSWPQVEAVDPVGRALNPAAYVASTLSVDATDNSYNDSALGLPALVAGASVYVTGFLTNAANNDVAVVVSRTTGKLVVTGLTLVTETAGASVSLQQLTIPTVIKRATAEYALLLLQGKDGMQTAEDLRLFSSLGFGDMRIVLRDPAPDRQDRFPLAIRRMLAPYALFAGMGMQIPVYRG